MNKFGGDSRLFSRGNGRRGLHAGDSEHCRDTPRWPVTSALAAGSHRRAVVVPLQKTRGVVPTINLGGGSRSSFNGKRSGPEMRLQTTSVVLG